MKYFVEWNQSNSVFKRCTHTHTRTHNPTIPIQN